MQPAAFLDRDDTIIHNDGDLGDPAKVRLIQGAASAIASLCGLGYRVVVVTNQGGVARGMYTEHAVEAVHRRISEMVHQAANGARIDAFYYCPYHPEGTVEAYRTEHPTRKPQPGMLLQAAEEHRLDLSRSWMIGDQLRDVAAGRAAGCRTILIRPAGAQRARTDESLGDVEPDAVVPSLIDAVRVIAQQQKPEVAGEIARPALGARRFDAAAVARLQQQRPAPRRTTPRETVARDKGPQQEPSQTGKANAEEKPATEAPEASAKAKEKGEGDGPASPASGRVAPSVSIDTDPRPAAPVANVANDKEAAIGVDEVPSTPDDEAEASSQRAITADHDNPATSGDDAASAHGADTDRTLRLILQELRQQRGSRESDFSSTQMLALLFQVVAVLCLVGGLWMGAGEENLGLFLRWMGAAVIFQGAAISALLFGK